MTHVAAQRLGASIVALAVGFGLLGIAQAEQLAQAPGAGLVTGEVARCVNGAEVAAVSIPVGVDGQGVLTRTDANGLFSLALQPGQYTVTATAPDGSTASRQYVPVAAGQQLDIGSLDLGAGIGGCGEPDLAPPAPAAAQPTPTAVAAQATPTVVAPTPTAVAAQPTAVPTPPAAPADGTPPEGDGSAGGGGGSDT